MFFVGATGQLLTLILTVCLPFILILSGNQKICIPDSTLQIEVRQLQHEIVCNDEINTTFCSDIEHIENQHNSFISENNFYKKIPLREFNVKLDWFCIDSSGNKAPPALYNFI